MSVWTVPRLHDFLVHKQGDSDLKYLWSSSFSYRVGTRYLIFFLTWFSCCQEMGLCTEAINDENSFAEWDFLQRESRWVASMKKTRWKSQKGMPKNRELGTFDILTLPIQMNWGRFFGEEKWPLLNKCSLWMSFWTSRDTRNLVRQLVYLSTRRLHYGDYMVKNSSH